jgi:hypothetical protein
LRKILIVGTGLLVFLLAACSGGSDTKEEGANGPPAVATEVVDQPTPVVEEPTAESESDGGLFEGALNPFNLLSLGSEGGSEGLPAVTGEGDPSLKAALVTLEDLPPGYSELMPGGMSSSFETDEGSMSMAASMFTQGEVLDEFPESMIMSGVVLASGDLLEQSLDELQRYNDPAELEREIEDALGAGQAMPGIGFEDLRVLDASGLGDGGIGLHMVMSMDMEAIAEGFGAEMDEDMPPEADFLKEGIAFDMYVFARGDHMLMVMSMWPGDGSAPLDIRALAEVMDTRAETAF